MGKSKKEKPEVVEEVKEEKPEVVEEVKEEKLEEPKKRKSSSAWGCVLCVLLVAFGYLAYRIITIDKDKDKDGLPDGPALVDNNKTEESQTEQPTTEESQTTTNEKSNNEVSNTMKRKVDYNYQVDSNLYEISVNETYQNYVPFKSYKEGEKLEDSEQFDGYLVIEDGVPTFVVDGNNVKSSFTNVKEMVTFGNEFETYYALLCDDGTVYVGDNFIVEKYRPAKNETMFKLIDVEEFNKAEKVVSSKKYVDLKLIHFGYEGEDTLKQGLVLVAEDGSKDLVYY